MANSVKFWFTLVIALNLIAVVIWRSKGSAEKDPAVPNLESRMAILEAKIYQPEESSRHFEELVRFHKIAQADAAEIEQLLQKLKFALEAADPKVTSALFEKIQSLEMKIKQLKIGGSMYTYPKRWCTCSEGP